MLNSYDFETIFVHISLWLNTKASYNSTFDIKMNRTLKTKPQIIFAGENHGGIAAFKSLQSFGKTNHPVCFFKSHLQMKCQTPRVC